VSAHFLDVEPSLANQWRAVILFGRNSASYKFALAEALLTLRTEGDLVHLDEIALPFARAVCCHLASASKQASNASSRFLDACRRFNSGQINEDQLRDDTVRLGFNNVLDAFHNLDARTLPERFFIDERQSAKSIRITDAFRQLTTEHAPETLQHETEARWRLVETAWELGLNRSLIAFDAETTGLYVEQGQRRTSVTSCRHALNGYQKGHCFHCFAPISILTDDAGLADVDHFVPQSLKPHLLDVNLDGVWNLVLACAECNRGPKSKFRQIPSARLLQRLHARNEYLIQSHHPLRETLMWQTGLTTPERMRFLQEIHTRAKRIRVHAWEPEQRGTDVFGRVE